MAVLWGAATLAFAALHLVPGDPVSTLLGGIPATPATVAELHKELGLGRPLIVQYGIFLEHLASGNLGQSFQLHQPVRQVILDQLWPTVELALSASVLAFVVAGLVALVTSSRKRRNLRAGVSGIELVAISTPSFWLGILLLTFFSFHLRMFPVAGNAGFRSLVLPAITLALPVAAVLSQVLREGIDHALDQPFIVTARARGVPEIYVRMRHALRHALLPVITLSGWIVGSLLSGAVLVETVFGRQGIGRVAATAIGSEDIPVVIGVVLVSAFAFVVINTIIDLVYVVIDPRLREV